MRYTQSRIEKANWDSYNFNLNIGDIFIENPEKILPITLINIIKQLISIGEKEQYQLLYLKLPSKLQLPEHFLHNTKIALADTKITYKKQIGRENLDVCNKYVTTYIGSEVSEALLNLSFESGKYSRFKLDTNFPPGTFEKMYSIWIDKSVKREIADNVLVYQAQDELLGMLTYSIKGACAHVGLIAVNQLHQGENIGSILLASLEYMTRDKKIDTIEVTTQKANLPACNFYQKNKFFIKEETNIYHIWL